MKILLVSATRKELHPIKKAIQFFSQQTDDVKFDFLTTGIGLGNARAKITTGIGVSPKYDFVINPGLAGSLSPSLNIGDVFFPTTFQVFRNGTIETISRANFENHFPETWIRGKLFSSEKPVVTSEQKSKITSACGALAVDMEAFALSESCRQAKIPFISLKIISDQADSTTLRTFFRELNKNIAILSTETLHLIRHILKQTESIHG